MRHILDTFAKIVTVTNHTGQWVAVVIWYPPSVTCQVCLYGLGHGLGIYAFRLTWPYHQPKWNFFNPLLTLLWLTAPSNFAQQIFLVASVALQPNSNLENIRSSIEHSSVWLLNHLRSEAMCNVGWFLWHINLSRLFNTKSIFM